MRYFVVVASIATVMLVTSPAFSGPQGESKTSGEKGRKSSLDASHSNTVYRMKSPNTSLFDFEEKLRHAYHREKDRRILMAAAGGSVTAKDVIAEEREGELTRDQVAELMANPFSYLWFGVIQNDTSWWKGDLLDLTNQDTKVMNTTLIQPVMSLQWSEKWRLIFRPVIPIHSFDALKGFNIIEDEPGKIGITSDWDRKTGLGDIVLWTAFSPQYKPPLVYGFGPTIMMNTASNDALGTGKWSAGPMGTLCYITKKWILGAVAQHWWSFAGDSDRNSVNLTDIQPIIRYRLSPSTNIGMAPNIQYNWDAKSGEQLRLPVGFGASTVLMLGKLPLGVGFEYYYYLDKPDAFGPEHMIRFYFTPVLPAPEWSRKPLFGK